MEKQNTLVGGEKCSARDLPLLDMPDDDASGESREAFARDLRQACSESGFFYLKPPKSLFGEEENEAIFEAAEIVFRALDGREDEDGLRELAAISRICISRVRKYGGEKLMRENRSSLAFIARRRGAKT